ncbi:MAG TPA: hypothetical protein VGI32_17940 [Steroidobacteraceae bacterium]|jgi:hypothetical protein
MKRHLATLMLATLVTISHTVAAAALDDIKLEVSRDLCEGAPAKDKSTVVYATNLNSTQSIDVNFKYDSNPAQQHFILFDANLNPITDRFPKSQVRRLGPQESARIGCTYTYRAAPQPPGLLSVPLVITKQSASYVDAGATEAPLQDPRSFAAFILQGGINECAAGAKPPGLFYLVNLHPYARLSASMNLLDAHGTRVGVLTPSLPPLSAMRVACSNGDSRPGPISSATLEVSAPLPEQRESPLNESTALPPLTLGAISRTQNVCAGSAPPGWIKINDAWNPTVCGKPPTITYNVWIIEQLSDQPLGAVVYGCKGPVPSGWAVVATSWNPTVCGHPTANQSNVMAIKRLS